MTEMIAAELPLESIFGFLVGTGHDSSIVDQNIQPVVLFFKGFGKGANAIERRKIERRQKDSSHIFGGRFAAFDVATGQYDRGSLFGQLARGFQTTARVGASYILSKQNTYGG